jgi:hypothetical protein
LRYRNPGDSAACGLCLAGGFATGYPTKREAKSNRRVIFKILYYLFCKKGNAKKLCKGSKEFRKVFFGSFFYSFSKKKKINGEPVTGKGLL